MVDIALERIADLFALAEREATGSSPQLPDRYVALARRIGMRYNVRLIPEFQELYCRGCSRYWVEGRTVRTRLREGVRVRTCLACGRERRVRYEPRRRVPTAGRLGGVSSAALPGVWLASAPTSPDDPEAGEGQPDER